MAAELHANPDVLSHVGAELVSHGQSLAAVQTSCHRDADGARLGWVGSSADALSGLLDQWATASGCHLARIDAHADGIRLAAAGFIEMDRHNADCIR